MRWYNMRNLITVLKGMMECLEGTWFLRDNEEEFNRLIQGSRYQAPESTVYWQLAGENIVEDLGALAECLQEREYINALAIWIGKDPMQVLCVMARNKVSVRANASKNAVDDSISWQYEVI